MKKAFTESQDRPKMFKVGSHNSFSTYQHMICYIWIQSIYFQFSDLKKSLLYGDFADVDFEAVDVHVLTSFIKVNRYLETNWGF